MDGRAWGIVVFEVGRLNAGSSTDLRWVAKHKITAKSQLRVSHSGGGHLAQMTSGQSSVMRARAATHSSRQLWLKWYILQCLKDWLACLSCDDSTRQLCSDIFCNIVGLLISTSYPKKPFLEFYSMTRMSECSHSVLGDIIFFQDKFVSSP